LGAAQFSTFSTASVKDGRADNATGVSGVTPIPDAPLISANSAALGAARDLIMDTASVRRSRLWLRIPKSFNIDSVIEAATVLPPMLRSEAVIRRR
jgi:hypothetical protein